MKINYGQLMKKATGASVGLAVAVAFFNVALLATRLIQTVAEELPEPEEAPESSGDL